MEWYRDHRRRGVHYSEIADLTTKMLGTRDSPNDQPFKGAECKALVFFLQHAVRQHLGFTHPSMQTAVDSLCALSNVVDSLAHNNIAQPTEAQCQSMFGLGVMHCRAAAAAGVHLVPKHHLFIHVLQRTPVNGSPGIASCWMDESLNKQLAAMAGSAHALVWERRIFTSWQQWQELQGLQV